MALRSTSSRLLARALRLQNPQWQRDHLMSLASFNTGCSIQPLQAQVICSGRASSLESESRRPMTISLSLGYQFRDFRATPSQLAKLEVKIQSMGESITEGEIAEILKKVGEAVEEDETIAQIETDKVTIDVRAPSAGKLTELRVSILDNFALLIKAIESKHTVYGSFANRVRGYIRMELVKKPYVQVEQGETVKEGQVVAVIAEGEEGEGMHRSLTDCRH